MNKVKYLLICGLICLCSVYVLGGWSSSYSTVLQGEWGSGPTEFSFVEGDTIAYDDFPGYLTVNSSGDLVIPDTRNERVKVYNSDGSLRTLITPQNINTTKWGFIPYFVGDKIFMRFKEKYQVYDLNGNLTTEFKGIGYVEDILILNETIIVKDAKTGTYYKYSPTGELLATYGEKPLELGVQHSEKFRDNPPEKRFKITIKFPDKEYSYYHSTAMNEWVIDNSGNLNVISDYLEVTKKKTVTKVDQEGNKLGTLQMPEDNIETISYPQDEVEGVKNIIHAQYGDPVVSKSGDVYTWKRTEDKYYIIKWEWQE